MTIDDYITKEERGELRRWIGCGTVLYGAGSAMLGLMKLIPVALILSSTNYSEEKGFYSDTTKPAPEITIELENHAKDAGKQVLIGGGLFALGGILYGRRKE